MNDWERSLFQGIGISRISKIVPQIPDITPSPVKVAILSIMLPSFHYIALVATLDKALTEYIQVHGIPWPNRTKRNLFNRIKVVSGVAPNINAPKLQKIRNRRNSIAHEPALIFSNPITWDELDDTIQNVCIAMKEMGLIEDIPQVTAFFERMPELFPEELGANGERLRQKYIVGAKVNDEVIMEIEKVISYFPPGNP